MDRDRRATAWLLAAALPLALAPTPARADPPDGLVGRLREALGVAPGEPGARARVRGAPSGLNVRAGPTTSAAVVGARWDGDEVPVLEIDGDWVRIGPGQWVHSDYLGVAEAPGGAEPEPPAPDPSPAPDPAGPGPAGVGPIELTRVPERPAGAPGGAAFLRGTEGLSAAAREARFLDALLAGNVPRFLRTLQPVTIRARGRDGQPHTVVLWVTPDYLAVGSDADFARLPLRPATAQRVADRFGCLLPTREIVDAVWAAAAVQLTPAPLSPGPQMTSSAYFLTHQRRIEAQWAAQGASRGSLTAGHKKDVVLSARLRTRPDRVAIYGWHRRDGRPIQPLSTVHGASYADYSHGARLVFDTALVDGQRRPVAEVLADPALWPLLSDEGPLADARVPGP